MERRILWLTPKWPLPCDDGARVATCSLLRGLARLGYRIDLLSVVPAGGRPDPYGLGSELGVPSAAWVEGGRPPRG